MKLDLELSSLINDLLVDEQDTDKPNLWADTHGWVKLADLAEFDTQHILTVRPLRRTYLRQSDAGYDWAAGQPFVITSPHSPHKGDIVAVDEINYLRRCGYTHIHIHYNRNSVPLELEL
jgi:hypothetical protein